MMDLETWANVAEILGGSAIVGGAVFATIQIREFRAKRRDALAVELMRSFYSPQFAGAVSLIGELPDGLSAADLKDRGGDYRQAALLVSIAYETIAFLVFRRMVSFIMVRELTGGIALVMWRKLETFVLDTRERQRQPSFAEWFQWLAEQLQRESEQKEAWPAYRLHADWRPRRRSNIH